MLHIVTVVFICLVVAFGVQDTVSQTLRIDLGSSSSRNAVESYILKVIVSDKVNSTGWKTHGRPLLEEVRH